MRCQQQHFPNHQHSIWWVYLNKTQPPSKKILIRTPTLNTNFSEVGALWKFINKSIKFKIDFFFLFAFTWNRKKSFLLFFLCSFPVLVIFLALSLSPHVHSMAHSFNSSPWKRNVEMVSSFMWPTLRQKVLWVLQYFIIKVHSDIIQQNWLSHY